MFKKLLFSHEDFENHVKFVCALAKNKDSLSILSMIPSYLQFLLVGNY